VIAIGQKGRKWAQGQAMRPVSYGTNKAQSWAAEKAGLAMQKIPGLKTTGRRLEARSKMIMRAPESDPQHKDYKKPGYCHV